MPASDGRRIAYTLDSGYYKGRFATEGGSGLEGMDNVRPTILPQLQGGHRSDAIVDAGYVNDQVYVGAVSVRGMSHHMSGSAPRQDHYAIGVQSGWLISVVADGVSEGPLSHLAAERAVATAQSKVRVALRDAGDPDRSTVAALDWTGIGAACCDAVDAYARQVLSRFISDVPNSPRIEDVRPSVLAKKMSTTLDIALVAVEPDRDGVYSYIRVRISGDSSAYLLDAQRGWLSVALGKSAGSGQIDNSVIPLPIPQGPPAISVGWIAPGQAFVHVTDGFGDLVQEGRRPVGRFLFEQWSAGPLDSVRLLHTASVVNANGDDDRTAVIVWVGL